jgi:hypothetical protein
VIKDVYTQRFNGSTRELVADLRGAVEKGDLIVTSDCIAMGPLVYYLPEARHLFFLTDMETMWRHFFTVFAPRLADRSCMQEFLSTSESFWFVAGDRRFSVTAGDILKEAGEGWQQTAGPTDYAHPYSRFTYTVSKFSRVGHEARSSSAPRSEPDSGSRPSAACQPRDRPDRFSAPPRHDVRIP